MLDSVLLRLVEYSDEENKGCGIAVVSKVPTGVFKACNYDKLMSFCMIFFIDTPSQRVQFILGTEDDDEEHIPHDLFTELDEICWREGEDAEWRETAR